MMGEKFGVVGEGQIVTVNAGVSEESVRELILRFWYKS
jgi:hypothetical protein